MGRKKEFDGEEIGRKLLDPGFKINCSRSGRKSYSARLERIRNDKDFRKAWEALWKWRYIGDKQTRIMFFKVQASLRNPKVQAKRAEFTRVEDLIEFYEYAEKHYHIPHHCCILYEDYLYQSGEPENLQDRMAVLEIFHFDREYPEEWDHALTYDLSVIESDQRFNEPVIYLRVDLRSTNTEIRQKIDEIVNQKRKELLYKAQAYLVWKADEMALMISDLDKFGFTDETIADLISRISGQDVSEHYVKSYLKKARHMISSSIKPIEDFLSSPSN